MPTTKSQLNAGLKVADVQAQGDLNAEQIAQKATEATQRLSTSPVITSETLKPVKPLKLPAQIPQTQAGAAQEYIQTQNNAVKTEAQQALDTQRKELDRNKNDIASLIDQLGSPTADKNAIYEQQGVNDAKKQVDEYTSQLEAEAVANQHRITELRKNKGGLFGGAVEQEINRINQDSLTKQADLAILQNNALRKYSTAAEIADRTLQAKIEPLTAKLEALKFFYTENKADFNKADDRAYAELIKKQEAETATKKENITKAFSSGLRNSFINEGGKFFRASDGKEYTTAEEFYQDAGVSSFEEAYSKGLVGDLTFERVADLNDVLKLRTTYPDAGISVTDSFQEAVQKLAGSNKYLLENKDLYPSSDGLKPTSLNGQDYFFDAATGTYVPASDFIDGGQNGVPLSDAELKTLDSTTEAKQLKSLSDLKQSMSRYKNLFDTEGFALTGTGKGLLDSAYADLQVKWKEAANLGALTGPDLDLLKQAIVPVTGVSGIKNKALYGKEGISNIISNNLANLDSIGKTQYERLLARNSKYAGSEYVRSLGEGLNINFSSAGTASSANQVKAYTSTTSKLQPISFAQVVNQTYKPGTTPVSYGAKSNECGYYARQVVKNAGYTYPTLGDGLNSKIAAVQKYGVPAQQANIGAVVVTRENPTYGHVAVILQKTPQGVIVTESNFKQAGKISNGRLIPWSKIVGAINPTKA